MINVAQSRIYSQMQILIYHHNQHFSSSDIFKTPRTAKQKDLFKSRKGRGVFFWPVHRISWFYSKLVN